MWREGECVCRGGVRANRGLGLRCRIGKEGLDLASVKGLGFRVYLGFGKRK